MGRGGGGCVGGGVRRNCWKKKPLGQQEDAAKTVAKEKGKRETWGGGVGKVDNAKIYT